MQILLSKNASSDLARGLLIFVPVKINCLQFEDFSSCYLKL